MLDLSSSFMFSAAASGSIALDLCCLAYTQLPLMGRAWMLEGRLRNRAFICLLAPTCSSPVAEPCSMVTGDLTTTVVFSYCSTIKVMLELRICSLACDWLYASLVVLCSNLKSVWVLRLVSRRVYVCETSTLIKASDHTYL